MIKKKKKNKEAQRIDTANIVLQFIHFLRMVLAHAHLQSKIKSLPRLIAEVPAFHEPEVGTWPLRLTLGVMATAARRPESNGGGVGGGGSSRLEVSIDGLTLSPDSEGEQESVERLNAETQGQDKGAPGAPDGTDDEKGDTARTMELKWGFSLQELYGLALKFFKGIVCCAR